MTHPSYRQSYLWTFSLKLIWSWMAFLTSIPLTTSLAEKLLLTTSFPETDLPSLATFSESQSVSCTSTPPSSKETFSATPSSTESSKPSSSFLTTPS